MNNDGSALINPLIHCFISAHHDLGDGYFKAPHLRNEAMSHDVDRAKECQLLTSTVWYSVSLTPSSS